MGRLLSIKVLRACCRDSEIVCTASRIGVAKKHFEKRFSIILKSLRLVKKKMLF